MDIIKGILELKRSHAGNHPLVLSILEEMSQYVKLYKNFDLDHPVIAKRCPHLVSDTFETRRYIFSFQNILVPFLPADFPQLVTPTRAEMTLYQNGAPIHHIASPLHTDLATNLIVAYQFNPYQYALIYAVNNAYYVLTVTVDEAAVQQPDRSSKAIDYDGYDGFTLFTYSTHGHNEFPIGQYRGDIITIPRTNTLQIGNELYTLSESDQAQIATTLYDADLFKQTLYQIVTRDSQMKGVEDCEEN